MLEIKKSKWICIIISLVCLLVVFLLPNHSDDESRITEITLIHGWGSTESDHVAMRQIYEDFEKENPDIKINLLSLPTTDEVIRKVEDSIMVGEVPDIIFFAGKGRDSIYQYMISHAYALNLMPYIEADAEFGSNLAPANIEYWTTADGRLYTISDVLIMSGGYWYNEDIFRNAGITTLPTTWDEFEAICLKIENWARESGNEVKALQLSAEGYLYFASSILAQKGICVDNGQVVIEQEKMMDTLSLLEQIHAYSTGGSGDYNYRDETSLFNEGNLAIYVNGVWGAAMISDNINASYVLLPSGADGLCCESAGIGYVLGSTGDSAREEASVRFLKYMMSPKVQERILIETQQLPANPKLVIDDYFEQIPRFCQAVAVGKAAKQKTEIPDQMWSNQQHSMLEKNIIAVLSGKMNKQTLIEMLTN